MLFVVKVSMTLLFSLDYFLIMQTRIAPIDEIKAIKKMQLVNPKLSIIEPNAPPAKDAPM